MQGNFDSSPLNRNVLNELVKWCSPNRLNHQHTMWHVGYEEAKKDFLDKLKHMSGDSKLKPPEASAKPEPEQKRRRFWHFRS